MEQIITGGAIFLIVMIIIELIVFAHKNSISRSRSKIRQRLKRYSYSEEGGGEDSDILRSRVYSKISFLNKILHHFPLIKKIDSLNIQANTKYPIGFYILGSFFLASMGFLLSGAVFRSYLFAVVLAPIFSSIPFLYLNLLKNKRIKRMQKQLPEALDLLARALKAGHAFTAGMRLAADEFPDPLGPEFSETLDEINFGVSVPVALQNLSQRIDCAEIRYFVVGVILQRETGGNLAELMGTLATLIRERFVFVGKVRTLAAEGKLSALILVILPLIMVAYLRIVSPDYMSLLFTDPMGQIMAIVALIMMVLGIIVMKKMVNIEV